MTGRRRERTGLDDESCRAHALLVAKMRRFLAVVVELEPGAPELLMEAALLLERNGVPGCHPFQVTRPDGCVELGYAKSRWAVELYRWLLTDSCVPERHRQRMQAVLLGFGAESIDSMEAAWRLMWTA
ncbi:MAG: hypothetical protein HY816_12930 [Candidatus Wallbacteria bacterium]|nr:hypothetical protein [Candidatus Wallbacteria bacterium]